MNEAEKTTAQQTRHCSYQPGEEYLLLDVDSCIKHGGNDYSELAPSCEEEMLLTRQMGL